MKPAACTAPCNSHGQCVVASEHNCAAWSHASMADEWRGHAVGISHRPRRTCGADPASAERCVQLAQGLKATPPPPAVLRTSATWPAACLLLAALQYVQSAGWLAAAAAAAAAAPVPLVLLLRSWLRLTATGAGGCLLLLACSLRAAAAVSCSHLCAKSTQRWQPRECTAMQ